MKYYRLIRLLRPKQWTKNVFVLVPMFFGGKLFDGETLCASLVTFMAYCFVASAIYCFNDIIDVEADRRHPVKCKRPIASGAVSVRNAYGIMAVLLLAATAILQLLPSERMLSVYSVLLAYFILNMSYCAKLKQFAILDVCIVAFGFVLRLFAGGCATDIVLSRWIVLMTFLVTLFMSFAKRRDDVLLMEKTGEAPRKNTIRYNMTFINQAITITASVTMVCYIMYTTSSDVAYGGHTELLYLTSVFVLLGMLRYIQLAVVENKSGEPTKVMLTDRFMQTVVVLWALAFGVIIYC